MFSDDGKTLKLNKDDGSEFLVLTKQ